MQAIEKENSTSGLEWMRTFFTIGPSILFLIIFLFLPLFTLFRISFMRYDPLKITVPGTFTIENYSHVLADPFYIKVIFITLGYGLATVLCSMILAYPIAYFFARTKLRIKKYLLAIMILPLTLSVVVLAFGWLVILGTDGIIDKALIFLNITDGHAKLLYNPIVVVIALIQMYLPYQVLCLMSSFLSIDPVLEDAAYTLGANGFRTFIRILLPLTIPGLLAGSTFVAIGTITAFIVPRLLGGIGISMLGTIIYEQTLAALNWPLGAALSVILFVLTFFIFWLFTKVLLGKVKAGYHLKG